MFDEALKSKLEAAFENIVFDEPLKKHVTMNVGGPADGFLNASEQDVIPALEFCKDNNIDSVIIGNGSNTIFKDGGFRGLVICIGRMMNEVEYLGDSTIKLQAGAKLSKVAECAYKNSVGGFEFLQGIPGNAGGALVMNAGAYGGEIKNLVKTVTYIKDFEIHTAKAIDLGYGYRESYFMDNPDAVIISAVLKGYPEEQSKIKELMAEYHQRRTASQPLEYPSSGSFFKRPPGYFAGKLIQDCGLKGYSVGGAAISEKHAGFVINTGDATCSDIQKLSDHVKDCVKEKFGVQMHHEVRFLGSDK